MSSGEDDDLFLLAEGLELLAAFRSIKIPTTRQRLLHLVIAVAEAERGSTELDLSPEEPSRGGGPETRGAESKRGG